jgi:outer membrane phospholipase A
MSHNVSNAAVMVRVDLNTDRIGMACSSTFKYKRLIRTTNSLRRRCKAIQCSISYPLLATCRFSLVMSLVPQVYNSDSTHPIRLWGYKAQTHHGMSRRLRAPKKRFSETFQGIAHSSSVGLQEEVRGWKNIDQLCYWTNPEEILHKTP